MGTELTNAADAGADEALAATLAPLSPEAAAKARAKRNNIVLVVLGLVGVAVVLKQFVFTGPKDASAATMSTSVGAAVGPVGKLSAVDQFLNGGAGDMKAARDLMRHTEQVVETFKTYPSVNQVPLAQLRVNPFRQSTEAKESETEEQARAKREQERTDSMAAAQALNLQSVLHSKVAPACLINNMLLREGQQVNGFTIDRIKPDSVILHRGIYRFEVKLGAAKQ